MNARKLSATTVLVGFLSTAAHATPVVLGDLSYKDNIITNTKTGTYYLGWDQAASLNYAETILATGEGGIYEEYHIASQTEAFEFFNAAGGSATDVPGIQYETFYSDSIFEGMFGAYNELSGSDSAFFLSDENWDVGMLSHGRSEFGIFEDWGSFGQSDEYSAYGPSKDYPITWLLVSDEQNLSPVPLPAAAWLFGSALFTFVAWSRRKNKKIQS